MISVSRSSQLGGSQQLASPSFAKLSEQRRCRRGVQGKCRSENACAEGGVLGQRRSLTASVEGVVVQKSASCDFW